MCPPSARSIWQWFFVLLAALAGLVPLPTVEAALLGHGGPVKAIAVSPDGRQALTGGFDYAVILWDLARRKPVARMIGHGAGVNAVAFLPDGRHGVSGGDDGAVVVWDLAGARVEKHWSAHQGKVAAIAVAPDGRWIASAGWDRQVRLWTEEGIERRTLEGHIAAVNTLAVSPDGALLASGDAEGRIVLWRVADGEEAGRIPGNGFSVNGLAFTADGRLISASADKTARLWDPATRRELMRYEGHEDPVVSVTVTRDGALVASGSAAGDVELWQSADGAPRRSIYAARGPAWTVAFTPDGTRLLTGGSDGIVREWDLATGTEVTGALPSLAPTELTQDHGAQLFRKCQACHTLTPDGGGKAGPTLYGLFGRAAGSVAFYPYSPALRTSGLTWTEETIDRLFTLGPEEIAPGSKMPLQKMPNPQDRADLIEFLKRATAGGGAP